jgi:site-specific DNA-methyltransferase (adenine-specific)
MVEVLHGDCVEQMRLMPDCSVDAIVTDPPYELGFMGKQWDGAGIAYSLDMWAEALRVLKPGGHLLAFGGTRTYHRMACAIEDAGFEIRDSIHWVYGSGFPKSLDVSKAIDKVNGEGDRARRFTRWMRSTDLGRKQCAELVRPFAKNDATAAAMSQHYFSDGQQPAIPTAAMWAVIRPHCGEVPAWVDELVARVEAEREVVGQRDVPIGHSFAGPVYGGDSSSKQVAVTAPATEEAARWEGWGTALKPAHEPIVVARKPLAGTVAGNVLVWGTGGLNVDGCRVPPQGEDDYNHPGNLNRTDGSRIFVYADWGRQAKPHGAGRWPANVVFDRTSGEALDQQSGVSRDGVAVKRNGVTSNGVTGWGKAPVGTPDAGGYGGEGGASRFFTQADWGPDDWPFVYQAKPSRKERNAGLDGLPAVVGKRTHDGGDDTRGRPLPVNQNVHPTVKPVALMRHLVRLVTPPGGTVLDPFAGSGTTLVAAILEGMVPVGIEMTDEYLPIIEGRVAWAQQQVAAEPPRLL